MSVGKLWGMNIIKICFLSWIYIIEDDQTQKSLGSSPSSFDNFFYILIIFLIVFLSTLSCLAL